MFIIGTAGHIDHGKSSIIMRLTGIDPDRLPEEKNRGMTIDLGFAYYDTGSGQRIGIVDVPGHERFVRNMIAGAGGIDAVMLVIASDDGWMPQSLEHFQIVKLLGIKYGIIALTKTDLAESSWTDLVEEDIRDKVGGTFLEKAPIVRVSSETGEGFDRLREEIEKLSQEIVVREDIGKPRLYCDRSFVLKGIGGVVTGTLKGGGLRTAQEVAVFPSRTKGKIRSIQSHNKDVDRAEPGQRTAVGFTGIEKENLVRGGVVSTIPIVNNYPDCQVFAIDLKLLDNSPVIVEDRRRLLMIVGTTEIEGEIRLFGDIPITPGNSGLIFFKPFEPVMSFIGDRCIMRLPTPQVTVGGGVLLDIIEEFPRKKELASYNYLQERRELTPENLIESELHKKSYVVLPDDFRFTVFDDMGLKDIFENAVKEGKVEPYSGKYLDGIAVGEISKKIVRGMKRAFEREPHLNGLSLDMMTELSGLKPSRLEFYLDYLTDKKEIVKKGNRFDLAGRTLEIKGALKEAADKIEKALLAEPFAPPRLSELTEKGKESEQAMHYLLNSGAVYRAGKDIVFHAEAWVKLISGIRELINKKGEITVADIRDAFKTTRKYAVPILEECDRIGMTERNGDSRTRGDKFE